MQKILIVVDMQNDFVSGALGTREAAEIVPYVTGRIVDAGRRGEKLYFTKDTHGEDYLNTQEGSNLPVPHCIGGTEGWEIIHQLQEYTHDAIVVEKPTFGSARLAQLLLEEQEREPIEQITLIGLCTDICVISNAMLIKTFLPETRICVDASCCAGVSLQSHENALRAMETCQIKIENKR